jgi:hypothetical protein
MDESAAAEFAESHRILDLAPLGAVRPLVVLAEPVGNGPPVEMAAVTVEPRPPLSIGTPEVLFPHGPYQRPPRTPRCYDVMPAGDEFVMVAAAATRLCRRSSRCRAGSRN